MHPEIKPKAKTRFVHLTHAGFLRACTRVRGFALRFAATTGEYDEFGRLMIPA